MRVDTAIRLVAGLAYKPGWEISAHDHTKRYEGAIRLHVVYPATETSREAMAAGYERHPIRPYADFTLCVSECDQTDLYRQILAAFMRIEEHEAREYLRVKETGWAPFHPHQLDGMRRWLGADIQPDLTFGLA